jgi:hypothetical protein
MERSGLDPPTTVPLRPRLVESILNVAIRSYRAAASTSTNFLTAIEEKLVDPAGRRVSCCAGSNLPLPDAYLHIGLRPVATCEVALLRRISENRPVKKHHVLDQLPTRRGISQSC